MATPKYTTKRGWNKNTGGWFRLFRDGVFVSEVGGIMAPTPAQEKAKTIAAAAQAIREAKHMDSHGRKGWWERYNPAGRSRSNPSDSALAGARILGVTRNRAGKVTALKLQLRPTATTTATAAGGGWGTPHTNPGKRARATRAGLDKADRETGAKKYKPGVSAAKRDRQLLSGITRGRFAKAPARYNPTQRDIGISYNVTLDGEWYDTYPGAYDGAANALKRARAAGKALAKRRAGVVQVQTANGKVLATYNRKGRSNPAGGYEVMGIAKPFTSKAAAMKRARQLAWADKKPTRVYPGGNYAAAIVVPVPKKRPA